jgi:large subunit ribosomal protein L9
MKVLLIRDVYKLGRAGDIKKVADGYGRNFLLPQGLAVLATDGARKQIETIKAKATARRAALNEEMSSVAEVLSKLEIHFTGKSGETGKLYGSITTHMIADAIHAKSGVTIERRQIEAQPIKSLGEHKVRVRLTVDLVPEVKVIVYREGEAPVGTAVVAESPVAPQATA